jgi:hypothetical protein
MQINLLLLLGEWSTPTLVMAINGAGRCIDY